VPVEGEGAALGAALHAAWVLGKESGSHVPLEALTDAFVVFVEDRRCQPEPVAVARHRMQRELFKAVSRRLRGLEGADPFAIRAKMAAAEA